MRDRRYYLKLKNYNAKIKKFRIKINNLVAVVILELSGDEVAKVLYKDGNVHTYDSGKFSRIIDYYDGIEIYTRNEILKSDYIVKE